MEATASYLLMLQNYIISKQKNSEIEDYALCLGNISIEFTFSNMKKKKKKTGLKRVVKVCSVDFNPVDTNDILDIHKYSMKRTWYKEIFGLIKKIFTRLLTSIVNASNHTKYVSLSN